MSVALVTGGSRGIGKAIVESFKAEGYKVATCATNPNSLEKIDAEFKGTCDVSKPEQVKNFVEETVQALGGIDVLVNNAGIAGSNDLKEANDEFWHRVMDINLHGTYYFTKAVLPHLPKGKGRIINISSVLGLKGVPYSTAYCAAKHAVVGFTKALGEQLRPKGITVNAICPDWVKTDMAKDRFEALGWDESQIKTQANGRFIEPVEIADYSLFLASEKAMGITGQALSL